MRGEGGGTQAARSVKVRLADARARLPGLPKRNGPADGLRESDLGC